MLYVRLRLHDVLMRELSYGWQWCNAYISKPVCIKSNQASVPVQLSSLSKPNQADCPVKLSCLPQSTVQSISVQHRSLSQPNQAVCPSQTWQPAQGLPSSLPQSA
ncbi:hypothetical protein DPMN_102587 [Dreissena polymorpha]|uniref:Uncharacterized protein n=1 Tax=Dreissena polymorpha TaxID=45954 RepID=A0A9D4LL78_DREPO|nr:hypothetical protein DPMN_102587 [Dreissena polymorpha]